MEHLPTFIKVSSLIVSIFDGGAMLLFLVGAATFRPNRTGQREGVFICILLTGLFGFSSIGGGMEAFMGGSYYYANTMPRELWPLVVFAGARLAYIALNLTLWIWTLRRFRQFRIEAR